MFSTRAPEPPTGASGTSWELPRNPEDVLDNMANAIGRRSSADYIRSFDETETNEFVYIPDPATEAERPGFFDGWSIDRERKFMESLLSPSTTPADSIAMLIYEIDRETVIGDSAQMYFTYNLHIGHVIEDAPIQMDGRSELTLRRGKGGGWYINAWKDFRIGSNDCWSDLRIHF